MFKVCWSEKGTTEAAARKRDTQKERTYRKKEQNKKHGHENSKNNN